MSTPARIVWTLVLLPFGCVPLIFFGAGWFMIYSQDYKMDHFLPVTAVVQSSKVSVHVSHGRHSSTTYTPEVSYTFQVDGRTYRASGVMPMGARSAGHAWANGISQHFRPGHSYPAWYDPRNPSDAFIVRAYSYLPPAIVLFSVPFVFLFTGGVGLGVLSLWRKRRPLTTTEGLYDLRPTSTITSRWMLPGVIAIVWLGVAALAVGDYLLRTRALPSLLSIAGTMIYLLAGLFLVRATFKPLRLSRYLRTPLVRIDSPAPRLGDVLSVTIQQEFVTNVPREVSVGVACESISTGKNTTRMIVYEQHVPAKGLNGHLATVVRDRLRLELPANQNPSRPRKGQTIGYEWQIRVNTRFADGVEDRADYRLSVEAARATADAPV